MERPVTTVGSARLPQLSAAQGELLHEIAVVDEFGQHRRIHIPQERPLTIFVDKRELVTLMTLGQHPEWLVLGYLLNQGLVAGVADVAAVQVDWSVDAAAVTLRSDAADWAARSAHRVVTTGCGQGTVYGQALEQLDRVRLPDAASARVHQATLRELLDRLRHRDSIHRRAGSVHGCALCLGSEPLLVVEDVGRHNAVDTIAGWMALHGVAGGDKLFYSTGRLTSEMVLKAARMGIPIVVSRNGVTQMGHELATRLGMALFGRASNRHFLCYCGADRFDAEPLPPHPLQLVAGSDAGNV